MLRWRSGIEGEGEGIDSNPGEEEQEELIHCHMIKVGKLGFYVMSCGFKLVVQAREQEWCAC